MSLSNDISGLFKWFGGRPEHYQEIPHNDLQYADQESSAHESAEADVAGGDAQGVHAQKPVDDAETPVLKIKRSSTIVAPVVSNDASVWSSTGLQELLAERARREVSPSVEAEAPSAQSLLERVKVIAVVSAKGGVGKTTLSASLASAMQRAGRPVVALDLDPQNALQHHFKARVGVGSCSALGIAHAEQDWHVCGMPSDSGVFVLPYGDIDEVRRLDFEQQLSITPDWLAQRLAAMDLEEGAVVFIDTPPGPSIYLRQALSVANEAVVVSLADAASYTALPRIEGLIQAYTAGRKSFMGTTYLINQVDEARKLSRDITCILQELLGKKVLGLVHHDPSIGDALAYNRNILEYDPQSVASGDILDCSGALVARIAAATAVCVQQYESR